MPDLKITQLTELAAVPDLDDLFHVIDDPSGTPLNKKISFNNLTKEVKGSFALSGALLPAPINADQDDYNPTGFSAATVIKVATGGLYKITGLQAGNNGDIKIFYNIGNNPLVFSREDANSLAANRCDFPSDIGDVTLQPKYTLVLQYDEAASRWRAIPTPDKLIVGYEPSAEWGSNLIRNLPSLELADGAQPEWWKKTGSATLTEEDANGEAIPEIHDRVLKLVHSGTAAGEYAYQEFRSNSNAVTVAGREPTLDDTVTKISTGVWVYTGDAGTVTLELYDVGGTASLGTDTTTTTGSWVFLSVENKTFQDQTQFRVYHSADNATVYFAMAMLNVGEVVRPWQTRSLVFREKYVADVRSAAPVTDWIDVDFTSNTSALTAALALKDRVNVGTGALATYIIRKGAAQVKASATEVTRGTTSALPTATIAKQLCDDTQIIQVSASGTNGSTHSTSMYGYWEWE